MTVEEVTGRGKEVPLGLKQLAMGHFSAEVTPEHLDRIEPRAVRRQGEQDQASRRGLDHLLYLIIFMRRALKGRG